MTPPGLAPKLQSLPPILHKKCPESTLTYSKAARGLSVLPRLIGIFTDIAISPGLCLRQCSHHYSIRAGQNLPDKEFRYLRTVIVTAAVHQGLVSKREPLHVTFWHWAGVSPYTSSYDLARTCVFDKQLHELFRCGLQSVDKSQIIGKAYPEVTPAVLPSSLNIVIPNTLVFSTRPPALVCGTVSCNSRNEDFLVR